MRSSTRWGLRAAAVVTAGLTGLALTTPASAAEPDTTSKTVTYEVALNQLNDSGASGTATVELTGGKAQVKMNVKGLLGGSPHAQHIHIGGGMCPNPDAATKHNGEKVISTVDGQPAYGKIGTSLTKSGDTSPDSALAVERFKDGGSYTYNRTIDVSSDTVASIIDGTAAIVVHGIDYNNNGEYDLDSLGESQLDDSLPLEATAPALCGVLTLPDAPVTYKAALDSVTTNALDNAGSGNVTVTIDGDQATVTEKVKGLAANLPTDTDTLNDLGIPADFAGAPFPHVQHIHIDGNNTCPGPDADTDGDGLITTVEGRAAYGGIGTTLSVKDSTSADAAANVLIAPSGDSYTYQRTFTMNDETLASLKNGTSVVVVHGLNPDTAPEAALTTDNSLGVTLDGADKQVKAIATAPTLCGTLTAHASAVNNPGCTSTPFNDVPIDNAFCGAITWLQDQNISDGYADGNFQPTTHVSRQAMAAFMYRLNHDGDNAPKCDSKPFNDVPMSNKFCGEINWMQDQGITTGYDGGGFHPTASVTRQAMAAFVYRMETSGKNAQKCTDKPFDDVSTSNAFCGEINWLKGKGLTGGYADDGFHPGADISRQANAAWFGRAAAVFA